MKWNESGFRPPLCTYRLGQENFLRMVRWLRWHCPPDTGFEPWWLEAEHATSRSRRLPTILTFTRGWGRNIFVSFKPPRPGTESRTLAWKAALLTTSPAQVDLDHIAPQVRMSKYQWHPAAALSDRKLTITSLGGVWLCYIPWLDNQIFTFLSMVKHNDSLYWMKCQNK